MQDGEGLRVRTQNFSGSGPRVGIIFWLIMIFLVVPFCGFFVGLMGTAFLPPVAYLTAPVVCSQGTLQVRQSTVSSSYQVSTSIHYDCVDSQAGTKSDVTEPVISVGGLMVAAVGSIGLGLIVILVGGIRFLLGRQTTR
jgi:hypothetical protein